MFRLNAATGTLFTGLNTYYIHSDYLDSPRSITNTAGQEVWRWDNTDPFGNNIANENPANQGAFTFNLRFPGQYFDKETGLHYNVNRDYNPANGRYVESDPIGLMGGINTYTYVNGNPLGVVDPEGLVPGDKWYGHNDPNFRDWVHEQKKYEGRAANENYSKEQLDRMAEQWEKEGKPGGKGNKSGKGGSKRYQGGYITLGMCLQLTAAILLMTIPSNIGQCEDPCKCGELCVK